MICSGIDLGTNTILMVIGEMLSDKSIQILGDYHNIARLGENVDRTGIINPEAIDRASFILSEYKDICKDFKVDHIYCAATSAMREAGNNEEVKFKLEKALGTEIHIITGEEEGKISFLGSIETDEERVLIDIGGGSSELIFGRKRNPVHKESLDIGSVRLTEKFLKAQPPSEKDLYMLREYIRENLKILNREDFNAQPVAVAGTATTIAAIALELTDYDPDKVHNFTLDIGVLTNVFDSLKTATIEEIVGKYHVHPKRADLITAGALILIEILNFLGKDSCIISSKGLRYGLLYTAFNSHIK